MKKRKFLLIIFLFGVLVACQNQADAPPTPTALVTVPATATLNEVETAVPTPPPSKPAPTATPNPVLPTPTLFDTAWDDREPFRAGLVDGQQAVLEQLPGASVYHLDFQLSAELTAVVGRLEVRYTNQENKSLNTVYFHLYPNLLGGGCKISGLTVNGEPAAPGYQNEQTILAVPLDAPLAPGEQVVIAMGFETAVPTGLGRNYGIFAYAEDTLALAHFYPVISAYDTTGWNLEPAPENGDVTYADTSFYLARVTAPANQIIVASGIEIEREASDASQTIVYAAGPMRDFYLAASPNYVPVSADIGQTTINSYAPADLQKGAEVVLDTAAAALEIFGRRFGTYPFTELDLVNTPTLALGIEYPGMIAITERIYDPDGQTGGAPNTVYLESTTAHEMAHQWFYSVVGNDQLDEPWLDESVTQYATWLYFVDRYGEAAADGFYQSLEGRWNRIDRAEIPIGLSVGAYEGAEYSGIIYGRGPIFVRELAQTMGQDTFDAFLRDYYTGNQWANTNTESFQRLAETHCNCDLGEMFAEWIYGQ
ncbi:MAG: M1 family metallopeptidase [Chloroflexi bacterium]|nr:M1 family metallopeptidase [Chloroflexota bacterium]